ncbi:MAG: ABC transporter substrate-binding protein, partial [Acidimicrobiales bacterium]
MNWKRLDAVRRQATPVENDLIEEYADGNIGRRDFVRKGSMIGLGLPVMGAVIAACGDDDDDTSSSGDDGSGDDGSGDDGSGDDGSGDDGGAAASGGVVSVAIQAASSGLDPVATLDQGVYNIVSQSFEYLVGVGEDGEIANNALATDWSPNETGDVWTFNLREGVKWQSGGDFTSADVAATMDRAAEFGNAGLAGVIDVGAVDASDPLVAVFTLLNPNGNFPVLVSNFNAQSLITPEDYVTGTLLDERPDGTGAWVLDSYDPAGSAKFSSNPNWWGGETSLDGVEIVHFDSIDTMVTAAQAGEVDAIQQFSVIGGEALIDNPDFVVLTPPAGTHRQIWFNTQTGQFTDPLVRQAMAWTFDRDRFISTLFNGLAVKGNDFPVLPTWAIYPEGAVEQRDRNIETATALMAEAGVDGISAEINCGDVQEVPDLAALMQQDARDAGFDLSINVIPQATFY